MHGFHEYDLRAARNADAEALTRIYNHYVEVGRKFDRYWSVRWFEKKLDGAVAEEARR